MARTKHGFCMRHRIAYNRDFDATCPQCSLAGVDSEQTDYNPEILQTKVNTAGAPVDASGKPIKLD